MQQVWGVSELPRRFGKVPIAVSAFLIDFPWLLWVMAAKDFSAASSNYIKVLGVMEDCVSPAHSQVIESGLVMSKGHKVVTNLYQG